MDGGGGTCERIGEGEIDGEEHDQYRAEAVLLISPSSSTRQAKTFIWKCFFNWAIHGLFFNWAIRGLFFYNFVFSIQLMGDT